jgi:hypothetical protein
MKNKLFRNCAYVSGLLFLGFIGLYAYVWIEDPNPQSIRITIGSNIKPLNGTNGLSTGTFVFDGGGSLHFAVTKEWGGYLVFYNQNIPYSGSIFRFSGDKTINETGLTGCGIYYRHITHTLEKDKNWWTLMVSLWYPIIMSGILPLALVLKKQTRHDNHNTRGAKEQINTSASPPPVKPKV